MHRGYIKLWRKSLDSTLWQNHNLWRFWTYCLLKASHADHTEMVGFQEVELKTGEFVFGRKVAAKETGLSEQNIRTSISCLKSTNNITIKVTNKFSIIHVQNWEVYQEANQQSNHQNNQLVTSNQPATNQQLTTNKNVKNVKNDKKKESEPLEEYIDRVLKPRFPKIDFKVEREKFDIYWSEGSRKLQRPKTAFTRWCENAEKYRLKDTPQPIAKPVESIREATERELHG